MGYCCPPTHTERELSFLILSRVGGATLTSQMSHSLAVAVIGGCKHCCGQWEIAAWFSCSCMQTEKKSRKFQHPPSGARSPREIKGNAPTVKVRWWVAIWEVIFCAAAAAYLCVWKVF